MLCPNPCRRTPVIISKADHLVDAANAVAIEAERLEREAEELVARAAGPAQNPVWQPLGRPHCSLSLHRVFGDTDEVQCVCQVTNERCSALGGSNKPIRSGRSSNDEKAASYSATCAPSVAPHAQNQRATKCAQLISSSRRPRDLTSPVIPIVYRDAKRFGEHHCDKSPNVLRSLTAIALQAQRLDQC
jgi:hypothetical protein